MRSRIVGSILLIVAMSIGGGLLSLPVVTAAAGYANSSLLLIAIWLVTMISALFILEACLWLPQYTNLIAMAQRTLGWPGQMFTWLFYLLMLYCILCVYVSGGTDLVSSMWSALNLNPPSWVSTVIFVGVLGAVVWHGIRLIDQTNRALMTGKMTAYLLLVAILAPTVSHHNLPSGPFTALSGALMPAVFSFGYAIIVPSLRSYLKGNVKQLRMVVIIGSTIPLACFLLWNYTVQGSMSQEKLISISQSGKVISQLNEGLSTLGNPWVITITHIFTTICILTAFLAVSLSLSDFLADGLRKRKTGWNKWLIYGLTFLPPLLIIVIDPFIFIAAIRFAGVLVVMILILLPTLMVIGGRYWKRLNNNAQYEVFGGKITAAIMLAASLYLLGFAVMHI